MTSTPLRESRLPVGSSASTIDGFVTSARAIATRCCWPPESWLGVWRMRSPSSTRSSASRDRRARSAPPTPAVEERQLHVGLRAGAREQVEGLEHEPDVLVAQRGEFVLRQLADLLALDRDAPGRRPVQQPDDVHQRGLPRAGGSHDRDHLALADVHGDVAQCAHLDALEEVRLRDVRRHAGPSGARLGGTASPLVRRSPAPPASGAGRSGTCLAHREVIFATALRTSCRP